MFRRVCHEPIVLVCAIAVSLLAGGCTSAPTAELKVFREGVVAANTAATPILDELAVSERKVKQAIIARQPGPARFVWQDSAYFSDIGDPPGTALFRRGHEILDRFSDILYGVASGANVKGDVDDIGRLVAESGGFVSELSAFVPVLTGADTLAKGAFEIARPALSYVATELAHREARRVIEAAVQAEVVKKLTTALIQATPFMFNVMIRDAERATQDIDASDDVIRNAKAAYTGKAAKLRIVLSNYVVLLQRVNGTWDEAANAAVTGKTVSVTELSDRVADLRAAVVATRRAYADMRTSP
jgi:hypothetical protein